MNQKGFINIIIPVVVVVLLGVVGYFVLVNRSTVSEPTQPETIGKINPLLDNAPVASSCARSYPKVGTFNEVVLDSSGGSPFTQISINNARTFETNGINNDGIFNIDKYEDIAREYIKNNDKFAEVPKDDWTQNEVKIFTEAIDKINIQKRGVIVNGIPINFCVYGFLGTFSPEGKIKYAVIRDTYGSYSYKGEIIEVEPGGQGECGQYTCTVQANFKSSKEVFTLSGGESYKLKSDVIKSITLLYASVGKEGAPALSVDLSKQVIYIIEFE